MDCGWPEAVVPDRWYKLVLVLLVLLLLLLLFLLLLLTLLGPHKAVAVKPAGKTRQGEGQDARVFLQDKDVL